MSAVRLELQRFLLDIQSKRFGLALVCKCNANATLCQIAVSENVATPKEEVLTLCRSGLYRVGGIGLETLQDSPEKLASFIQGAAKSGAVKVVADRELLKIADEWQ